MKGVHHHFSRIASRYRDLRTTDLEPILFIKERLQELARIDAADIGCGGGRYDVKLYDHLGDRLYLICIDENKSMLDELTKNLNRNRVKNFKAVKAPAENLPLSENSLDCMFSFNAVHHFSLLDFFKETSRVLRDDGRLFIYTRLQSQNKKNIWGRFFPKFYEKEKRLYTLDEFREVLNSAPILKLESIEYFKYRRRASLEWLMTQAKHHHYSTFYLYDEKEFDESLEEFKENISINFENPDDIFWDDENIMFNIRKSS
nr:class I SAM-dependent methyltransferase [Desulfobacterales bacterium]